MAVIFSSQKPQKSNDTQFSKKYSSRKQGITFENKWLVNYEMMPRFFLCMVVGLVVLVLYCVRVCFCLCTETFLLQDVIFKKKIVGSNYYLCDRKS